MASTVITPVADALAAVLATVTSDPALNVHWDPAGNARWAPGRLGNAPAVVIDVPRMQRTALDEPERELGSDDWLLTFPVTLFVDLKVPGRDQQLAIDLLEAMTSAIDTNPSLGIATIDDTKLVSGDPSQDLSDEARPLLAYECEIQVWKRVTT